MHKDFDIALTNPNGTPAFGDNDTPLNMRDFLSAALGGLHNSEHPQPDAFEKDRRGRLAFKLFQSNDFTPEELALMKKTSGFMWAPFIVTQINSKIDADEVFPVLTEE